MPSGGAPSLSLPGERWQQVDEYVNGLFAAEGDALREARAAAEAANLPAHEVTASQGKLLKLLAEAIGARAILELGTLAGYSTIWLGRALPPDGYLLTLEVDPVYAEVARANIAGAGLADRVEVRVGPALAALPALAASGVGPFDLIFLDADKRNNPRYLPWLLNLSRPGTLIVADNVIRDGQIVDDGGDETVRGVREFFALVAQEPRLSATVIQTVGAKGYDGFLLALVGASRS